MQSYFLMRGSGENREKWVRTFFSVIRKADLHKMALSTENSLHVRKNPETVLLSEHGPSVPESDPGNDPQRRCVQQHKQCNRFLKKHLPHRQALPGGTPGLHQKSISQKAHTAI